MSNTGLSFRCCTRLATRITRSHPNIRSSFSKAAGGASQNAISFASTARSTTATIRFSSSRRNSPERSYPRAKRRAKLYAQNLRAPLLLLTNGEILQIWQMQITQESECVLSIPVASLASERGNVERLLNKAVVRDYCRPLPFKTIVEATDDFGRYETAELGRMARDEPSIARTLRGAENAAQPATLETIGLLVDFLRGAIVIAPSGFGKTTLSRGLFKQAIEARWRETVHFFLLTFPCPTLSSRASPWWSSCNSASRRTTPE